MAINIVPTTNLQPVNKDARRRLFTEARTANTFTDAPVTDDQLRTI